jgi:hypothetical protein
MFSKNVDEIQKLLLKHILRSLIFWGYPEAEPRILYKNEGSESSQCFN